MSKHTGQFGEPWKWGDGYEPDKLSGKYADCQLFDCHDREIIPIRIDHHAPEWDIALPDVLPEKRHRDRITSCVNALANIPDPQAFVEAVRGLLDITGKGPIGEPLDHGKAIALAIEQIREHLKESPRG